jgi:hypothetical protein
MLKKIFAFLILLIAVLAVVIAMQPADFKVARSATMAAPADAPFSQANDFAKWQNWSPWENLDKHMKRTFEGPQSGVGAIYKWSGNDEVGEGQMTIVESKPNEFIKIKLEFIKPMEGLCETIFTFTPEGDKTNVKWSMSGTNNFVGKAFHLFMNGDKMIGDYYEQGLAKMKTVVETPAAPAAPQ